MQVSMSTVKQLQRPHPNLDIVGTGRDAQLLTAVVEFGKAQLPVTVSIKLLEQSHDLGVVLMHPRPLQRTLLDAFVLEPTMTTNHLSEEFLPNRLLRCALVVALNLHSKHIKAKAKRHSTKCKPYALRPSMLATCH